MKKEITNLFKNVNVSESQNFNSIKITCLSSFSESMLIHIVLTAPPITGAKIPIICCLSLFDLFCCEAHSVNQQGFPVFQYE